MLFMIRVRFKDVTCNVLLFLLLFLCLFKFFVLGTSFDVVGFILVFACRMWIRSVYQMTMLMILLFISFYALQRIATSKDIPFPVQGLYPIHRALVHFRTLLP
jgi:hypothetical protein